MERGASCSIDSSAVDNLQREDPIMEWTDRSRLSTQTKLEGRTLGCVYDAAHFYRGRQICDKFPGMAGRSDLQSPLLWETPVDN